MIAILQDFLDKIKARLRPFLADQALFTAVLLILVATASFGLGRQSVLETGRVIKETVAATESRPSVASASTSNPLYVASKKGKAYHLLICPGAKQISEVNKIYFKTKQEAEAAGYSPAVNCKGI